MIATTQTSTRTPAQVQPAAPRAGFGGALHAEWVKFATVRSIWWTCAALVGLGAGLTVIVCALQANEVARFGSDDSPAEYLTWGMSLASLAAVVLAALVVTTEYASGMIRNTFTAVPSRGTVIAAKATLLAGILLVLGTATALAGYLGGNAFFTRAGVGVPLTGDMLRAVYGNGLYLAGLAVMTAALGFILRNMASTIAAMIAVLVVVANLAGLVPGKLGQLVTRVLPNASGGAVANPSRNPGLWGVWTEFGVFAVEIAILLGIAWVLARRRDA